MLVRRFMPLVLVWAFFAAVAVAQLKTLKGIQNKVEGFALSIPEKWDGIPPQPTELEVVAKWAADAAKRGGYESYELQILRFVRERKAADDESPVRSTGDKPGDGDGEDRPRSRSEMFRRYREANRARSFEDWYKANRRNDAELPAPAKVKAGDAEMKLYLVEGFIAQGPYQSSLCVGVLTDAKEEWAVVYQVPTKDLFNPKDKKASTPERDLLQKSIKSFRFIPKEKPEDDTPEGEPAFIAEIRKRVKRGLPEGWRIWPTPQKQYVVVHNIPQEKTKQILFAKDILKNLEGIRAVYEKRFPPKKPITAVSVVRVCRDREEYFQYGGPGGSAGYFNSADDELVIYDASKEGGKKDSMSTLFHEAFHQYIHYAVGEFAPHSWYNEGFGDYFAGANPAKGFEIGPFAWRTGVVKNAVGSGKAHHLRELMKMTQAEYYSDPETCYAQGWALVYFLNSATAKKNPVWAGILDRYFETMVKTGSVEKALAAALKEVDIEELNTAYVEFVKGGFKP